jgi:hypothetical protein
MEAEATGVPRPRTAECFAGGSIGHAGIDVSRSRRKAKAACLHTAHERFVVGLGKPDRRQSSGQPKSDPLPLASLERPGMGLTIFYPGPGR